MAVERTSIVLFLTNVAIVAEQFYRCELNQRLAQSQSVARFAVGILLAQQSSQ